ncbi:sugar kinase (plasmid) [Rhizobium grahamii]|uniref:Sugar kinase n=1 Tax=Rhizobium grahamii TaxID=1120045 RepID=A0A5Q0CGN5_9HYPH|nr:MULTISPECIES: sugar kinase [Rhizobium]QFY63714.1 sugar kinase [Rhizobium grahamii]QRM51523.1 sugar kinase [Rhizobium sp. BG6]
MTNTADDQPGRVRHVLCVGAAVLDTLFRVRTMPTGQGKVLPYEMLQIAEGMASSAAFAVTRLGGKASLWGAVGNDDTGARIVSDLQASGVNTNQMRRVDGARSALSTILIDDDGERLIVPFYDRRLHDVVPFVSAEDLADFDAVLVDVRWPQLAQQTLRAAQQAGIPAILDGDVAPDGIIEMLAPSATHIVFSQPAAERVSGLNDPLAIVIALKERFSQAFISVTMGEKGCYWFDGKRGLVRHLQAPRIKAVDTLAAGDIFHGTFALTLAEQMPMEEIMRLSSMAAAIKCQRFGGRIGAPTRPELHAALADWQPAVVDMSSRNSPDTEISS